MKAKLGDTVLILKEGKLSTLEDTNEILRSILLGQLHPSVLEEHQKIILTTSEMVDAYNDNN